MLPSKSSIAFSLILLMGGCCAAFDRSEATTCSVAAQVAEARHDLPSGLLTAIATVESGGWNASVNGNDGLPGRRFPTIEDAVDYTSSLLSSGTTAVDVGCFQVDLRYHPDAFTRWQDAFDGDANAEAAAAILDQLHAQTRDWDRAIALYHSADPYRGSAYLQAVRSAWHGDQASATPLTMPSSTELRPMLVPVMVWGPATALDAVPRRHGVSARLPRIITP